MILIEEGRFSIDSKTAQPIRINGTDGLVERGANGDPNFVVVSWKNGKVSYSAAVTLGSVLTEDRFLQILNSMR